MEKGSARNGSYVIGEIRREPPVFPVIPRGRKLLLLVSFLFAVALLNVWLTGKYYRIGYAVSTALDERRTLQSERELLRTEILSLRSPARIEAIARAELGMIDPRTDRILLVR